MIRQPPSLDIEHDYVLRRARTRGFSYAVPINPFPDELLEDILIRAACENGFAPVMSDRMLGLSLVSGLTNFAPRMTRRGVTPETLSTILGNFGGPDEFRHLFRDEVPPRKDLRPFFHTWLPGKTFTRSRRISPRAIKMRPYLRAIWRVWPIGFDPETKELLLKDCPVCRKRLSANFMGDIWHCDHCVEITDHGQLRGVDLRDHEQEIIDEVHWDLLDFATSFLDPAAGDRRVISRERLHPDLGCLGDGQVFEFIYALARILPGNIVPPPGVEVPPTALAEAARVVRDWPSAFEDVFGRQHRADAVDRSSLSYLVHNSRLNPELRVRIRELVRGSTAREILELPPGAEARLNTHPHEYRTIKNWMQRGAKVGDVQAHTEIILLRSRAEVRTVSENMGIPLTSLVAMGDDNFFPSSLLGDRARVMMPSYRDRFLKRVVSSRSTSELPKYAIRLPRAVYSLFSGAGDPWAAVFKAMFSGRIKYWFAGGADGILVERLFVQDLEPLRAVLSEIDSTGDPYIGVPYSRGEAGRRTRLMETGFSSIIRAGLIVPPFSGECFAKFLSEYEPSNLFTVRLISNFRRRLMPETLASLQAAGIVPVPLEYSGTLSVWRREEIEGHFGSDLLPRGGR